MDEITRLDISKVLGSSTKPKTRIILIALIFIILIIITIVFLIATGYIKLTDPIQQNTTTK
jgi:hypothetical protein